MDWLYEYDEERHMEMERKEWHEIGLKEGMQKGIQQATQNIIKGALKKGHTPELIAEFNDIPIEVVLKVANRMSKETN